VAHFLLGTAFAKSNLKQNYHSTMSRLVFRNPAIPSLVESFLNWNGPEAIPGPRRSLVPSINILEKENGFQIDVVAPGLKKEDFIIKLQENRLVIRYDHVGESESTQGKFTRQEFVQNSFQRSFILPDEVDTSQIQARYVDGILQVELRKKVQQEPRTDHLIAVQ
jgi:HSP20 family protein